MKHLKFYVDFDGTITQNDVVDMMLERFADKAWQVVEREWQDGKIGSRECLARQIALLRMTPAELTALCDEIKIDDYFISFLKSALELQVPVCVVSDGFEDVIYPVLGRVLKQHPGLLHATPVFANKLEWTAAGPKAVFLSREICAHGCANCKPEVIKKTAPAGNTVVFIGDGHSDRYAAKAADVTFAKGKLLKYCAEQGLNYLPYENFSQIENWLRQNASAPRAGRQAQPETS